MGYTVRTPEWRYTLWVGWDNVTLTPIWDGNKVEELYDHTSDNSSSFDRWENVNLADANPDVVKTLRLQLVTFFNKE